MSAEFLNDLRTRPAFMVSHLRDLFLNPGMFKSDQSSVRNALATQFRAALRGKPMEDQVGRPAWHTMLTMAKGLPVVYADIVISRDFFRLPPDDITAILVGFHGLLEQIEDIPSAALMPLVERTVPLWSSIWDRRAELQAVEGLGHKEKLIMQLIELLGRFSEFYHTVHERAPPPEDSHMHHVGLLLYVLSEQDVVAQTLPSALHCFLSIYGPPARIFTNDAELKARSLVGHDVQTQIGIENIIRRFKTSLATPHALENTHLILALLVIWIVACSPETLPVLDKHQIFHDINKAVSQNDSRYKLEDRLTIFYLAQGILGILCAGRLKPDTDANLAYIKSIRGDDLTDHFARGITLHAETTRNMSYKFSLYSLGSLRQDIYLHSKFIEIAMRAPSSAEDQAPLIIGEAMRSRACELWWPSLCSLQKVAYRRIEAGHMVEVWTEYGNVLGLEEVKEKERHQTPSLLDGVYQTFQAVLYWPWGGA